MSERLLLRRWTEADVDRLEAAVNESLEHLRPWMVWAAAEPISRAERLALLKQWQADWEAGDDVAVGAFDSEGAVVGSGGLHRRLGPDALEIGYWIHARYLRQGFATEMARALTTAAFGIPEIERVEIHHDKANVASSGVPRTLGFTMIGEHEDEVTSPGEAGVECRWAMTRAAFRRQQA